LACNIKKKLDANCFSFGHLTLILLPHYLVEYRSHAVIEPVVGGEWRQCLPLAFVLEEDILSTRYNKDDVMVTSVTF